MERFCLRRIARSLLAAALLFAAVLTSAGAQEERLSTDPTAWWWYVNQRVGTISSKLTANNARIIDLEVTQASPLRVTVIMVENSGAYAKAWWWFVGLDGAALGAKLTELNARILDLEVYAVAGKQRFAAVLVPNTGADAKAWWWYVNVTSDFLSSKLTADNARLIDLESYVVGGERRYSAVLIANTGTDAMAWWWYIGQSSDAVASNLQANNARLIDIESEGNGKFAVIMEQAPGHLWWWYFDATLNNVSELAAQNGARIVDIERYVVGGQQRFAVIMVDNSNALTSRVGQLLRTATDGVSGLYLKRVNGAVLGSLQDRKVFEPASTVKVFHHLYAMLQVQDGLATLDDPIRMHAAAYTDSCPPAQSPAGPRKPLREVLTAMMVPSDNGATDSIRRHFGISKISTVANIVGMSDSNIDGRPGCAFVEIGNKGSLVDFGLLYEAVANGLLNPTTRASFIDVMLHNLWADYDAIIAAEGAALGRTAAQQQSFKDRIRTAFKGGSYSWTYADGQTVLYVSIAGWIELPACEGGAVVTREYVYGAFVDKASTFDEQNTGTPLSIFMIAAELMRDEIREALQTWTCA